MGIRNFVVRMTALTLVAAGGLSVAPGVALAGWNGQHIHFVAPPGIDLVSVVGINHLDSPQDEIVHLSSVRDRRGNVLFTEGSSGLWWKTSSDGVKVRISWRRASDKKFVHDTQCDVPQSQPGDSVDCHY
ncbi:hypothetical protein [Kibdelosporangium philippinense]|uniref:hypothetical protein n=1 Tax=Kibdelosporangium philippinense TaxID=211113 RepID=UPI0036154016